MTATYTRLLVPLDGSDLAAQALPHALAVAQRGQSQIILIHVVPDAAGIASDPAISPISGPLPIDHFPPAQLENMQQEWARQGQSLLDGYAESLRKDDASIQTALVMGKAADAIIDYAAREAIDLIVMSTHGRSGIARWVYGSVATRVLHAAPCPVLLVRVAQG